MNDAFDTVIIGGGFSGLLALRHLVNEKRQGPALLLLARIVSTRFKVAVRMTKLSMSRRSDSTKQSEEDCLDEMLVAHRDHSARIQRLDPT